MTTIVKKKVMNSSDDNSKKDVKNYEVKDLYSKFENNLNKISNRFNIFHCVKCLPYVKA